MLDFFKSFAKKTGESASTGAIYLVPTLAVAIGVMFLAVAHFSQTTQSWRSLLISIGSMIFSGGAFAFFLKSYQYVNLFRDELLKIFGDPQFSAIVRNAVYFDDVRSSALVEVSDVAISRLLRERCPDLSNDIGKSLAAICGASDYEYYVESHIRKLTIVNYDKSSGMIEFRDNLEVKIVPRSRDVAVTYAAHVSGKTKISLSYLKLNGISANNNLTQIGELTRYDLQLVGRDSHQISREYLRNYLLHEDPILHVRLSHFNRHVAIQVVNEIPDKVCVFLKPNGFSSADWTYECEKLPGSVKVMYSGTKGSLTFPGQGYIIGFSVVP